MPTRTWSTSRAAPSARRRRAAARCLLDRLERDVDADVDAVVAVQAREPGRDLGAEDPQQRQLRALEHGDVRAGGDGRRGDLQADPATADQRQPGAGGQQRAEPVGVLDRAQVVDGGAAVVGHRQVTRPGRRSPGAARRTAATSVAGGDRRAAGSSEVTVAPRRRSTSCVVVPLPGMHVRDLLGAHEVALGQRRSLVRRVRLVAEQDDAAGEALVAQGPHCLAGGQPAAHDHECLLPVVAHQRLLAGARQGQELGPCGRVLAQRPGQRRGHRAGAGGAHPAQAHAGVFSLDHDADTPWVERGLEVVGDLLGEALLGLGPSAEEVDEPGQLGQAEDPLAGQVADGGDADEGQHVVLAQRPHRDVLDQDQLVVLLGVGEAGEVEGRDGQQLGIGGSHAAGRLQHRLVVAAAGPGPGAGRLPPARRRPGRLAPARARSSAATGATGRTGVRCGPPGTASCRPPV